MNFLLRALTSLVYVSLLLGSLFVHATFFSAVLYLMTLIAVWELQNISKKKTVLVYLVFALLFISIQYYPKLSSSLLFISLFGNFLLLIAFWQKKDITLSQGKIYFLGIVHISLPMVLLAVFAKHHAVLVALFFCIIWLNDAAAFLIGSSIGKTPLAKSISPNKTYEGFVGGVLLASIATVLVGTQCLELSYYFLFSIAVITAITASIGDLIQSKVKRICNVKDSGRILPGHGGVYDRIDSTLFAIPVFLGMLYLFLYVS